MLSLIVMISLYILSEGFFLKCEELSYARVVSVTKKENGFSVHFATKKEIGFSVHFAFFIKIHKISKVNI